ncbi:hypothetical protein LIER_12975 [Lithospermum erythrorhizon]|uniref:Glycine cleavage system H protein n=1 Tax=Lithospermum erythrorhizon TaxID=34254 RepID=A0AAV3PYA0_LITER
MANQGSTSCLNSESKDAKPLTITGKLMTGKHVVDMHIKGIEQSGAIPEGEAPALLIKAHEEEQQRLEAEIQLKKGRVSELASWCLTCKDHLGEVVFVELPEPGTSVSQGKGFGAVESVKATSDINSPISGEVIEVNSKLTEAPGQINTSPYEDGWMIKVKPNNPSQLETLMGAKEYTKFCEEEDAAH